MVKKELAHDKWVHIRRKRGGWKWMQSLEVINRNIKSVYHHLRQITESCNLRAIQHIIGAQRPKSSMPIKLLNPRSHLPKSFQTVPIYLPVHASFKCHNYTCLYHIPWQLVPHTHHIFFCVEKVAPLGPFKKSFPSRPLVFDEEKTGCSDCISSPVYIIPLHTWFHPTPADSCLTPRLRLFILTIFPLHSGLKYIKYPARP